MTPRRQILAVATLCLCMLLLSFNATAVNVALPAVARDLDSDVTQLQWIILSYNLAVFAILFVAGAMGDRWGHFPTLLEGLVVFALTSVIAAYSNSGAMLVILRALMGIGAAVITPTTLALVRNVVEVRARGRAVALWTAATAMGMPLGPIVGGQLVDRYGWQTIFLASAAIAGLAIIGIALSFFRASLQNSPAGTRYNLAASAFVICAASGLTYSATELGRGEVSVTNFVVFSASVALAGIAIWQRRTVTSPLYIEAEAAFHWACGLIFILFFSVMGILFVAPLYLQVVGKYSATECGLLLLPLAACLSAASVASEKVSRKFGLRGATVAGFAFLTIGLAVLAYTIHESPDPHKLVSAMILIGIGVGAAQAPLTNYAMSSASAEYTGRGSALINMCRQVGGIFGVAVAGVLMKALHDLPDRSSIAQVQPLVFSEAVGFLVAACSAISCTAILLAFRHLPKRATGVASLTEG